MGIGLSAAKSSFLYSSGTMLSRLSGLVRDQVVLGVFGASVFMDAFYVAFRIPNLLREMLAEGALGSAFTKVFASLEVESEHKSVVLLVQTLYLSALMSLVVVSLGVFWAPELVGLFTLMRPSSAEDFLIPNATFLTKLLFPYLGVAILGAISMGALNTRGRFFLTAVSPILFNLGFIFGALVLSGLMGDMVSDDFAKVYAQPEITGLALGVLLGGAAHFLVQFLALYKLIKAHFSWSQLRKPFSSEVTEVVRLMIPAAIAAGAGPVNLFVNTNFATGQGDGPVTWLNTAFRLLQLPVGVFGVAVGLAALPRLAKAVKRVVNNNFKEVSTEIHQSIELVLWLMIPCMIVLMVGSQSIVTLLFEHGAFSSADSLATGRALFAYGSAVVAYGLIKVLTSFYYAVNRTSWAMKVSLFSILVNGLGNYLLVDRMGYVGLAWTASITLTMNCFLLFWGLRKHQLSFNIPKILKSLSFLGLACLISLLVQRFCLAGLASINYLGFDNVKLKAGLEVLFLGGSVVTVFIAAGQRRLGHSLLVAVRQIRSSK